MEDKLILEKLILFGLTRQEASLYLCLLQRGLMSGYESAKHTGISRSNAYGGLSGLVEKGAAYIVEDAAVKYSAVPIEEFCTNRIRNLTKESEYLKEHIRIVNNTEDGYITISGYKHIWDKILTMLKKAGKRVYISANAELIERMRTELEELVADGRKLVLITDQEIYMQNAKIYYTKGRGSQFRLIIDSEYALTGEIDNSVYDTVLYSGQKNFVSVFKEAMSNEIKLIELTKGEKL